MGTLAWKVVGAGSVVLASAVADRALQGLWRAVRGTRPPTAPEDPETDWKEAVAWAVLSGAVIGLARLVATRQAAAYQARSTGGPPRALRH